MLSIVMVSYHTGAVLLHALARALAQQGLAELVLVDNGNPAPVLAELQAWAAREERLKLITGHGNVGFARGCNIGARAATGETLLLLNPDCLLPEEDTAARLAHALRTFPGAVLAGPHLLNPDGSEQRGGRRQLLTPATAVSESLGLHRLLHMKRLNEHETPLPPHTHEVPAISGACMCISRADYEALGGMDEGFFLHVEDLDFCYRAQAKGKIICMPEAKVVHLLSSSDAPSAFIEWHKARGFMRYFRKHFSNQYPRPLLWLANAGILARFLLKRAQHALHRFRPLPPAAIAGRKLLLMLEAAESARALTSPPQAREKEGGSLSGRHIIVTGASSPVGALLIGRLLAAGAVVTAIARSPAPPLEIKNLRWQQADLTTAALPEADALIHCAPLWVLPPALHGIKRLIAFGSTSIYGKETSANAYEQGVVRRLREAEALLAAQETNWTILRPTLIYGTGLDGNVARIGRTIRRCGFFPLFPPARGLRQPVHADDLAIAAIRALDEPRTHRKDYNVSGAETLTYRDMVARIFRAMGRAPRLLGLRSLPLLLDAAGRLRHNSGVNGEMARRMNQDLVFSHAEATQDFGYAPRAFLAGGITDIEGR